MDQTFPGAMEVTLLASLFAFAIMTGLLSSRIMTRWAEIGLRKTLTEVAKEPIFASFCVAKWALLLSLFALAPSYFGLHDVTEFRHVLIDDMMFSVIFHGSIDGYMWSSLIEVTGVISSAILIIMAVSNQVSGGSLLTIEMEKEQSNG